MRKKRNRTAAIDLSALLRRRLPARDLAFLRAAGRAADRAGVGLYLVGGVVRDLLRPPSRSRPPTASGPDLDLVVDGDGPAFARRLAAERGGEAVVHERFLTATVRRPDGGRVDLAGARRETYPQPAALPRVAPGTLDDDARRRDFTVNALAVRLNAGSFGTLHDPCGGRADLARRVLRILHPRSFRDDPTRILRAARYSARCGLRLEAGTLRALRAEVRAGGLDRLTGARLWRELERVLAEPDPEPALRKLREWGVLARLHPRLAQGLWPRARWDDLAAGVARLGLPDAGTPADLRALALFAPLSTEQARALTARLNAPSRLRRRLNELAGAGSATRRRLLRTQRADPALLAPLLGALAPEVLAVVRVQLPRNCRARAWIAAYWRHWRKARPVLTGRDLQRLGYPPGPGYTRVLAALRAERLSGLVRTRADEVRFVKRTLVRG